MNKKLEEIQFCALYPQKMTLFNQVMFLTKTLHQYDEISLNGCVCVYLRN